MIRFLQRLFRPKNKNVSRDSEGRFVSEHRMAVGTKSLEMARKIGRDDIVAKLLAIYNLS